MEIQTIEIESFKRIETAQIKLSSINVIVGPNNSGKSSILQAIHFHLIAAIAKSKTGHDTFGSDQLTYNPSFDFSLLRNDRPYGNSREAENNSKLKISGKNDDLTDFSYEIEIRKGRNEGNITCTTAGDQRVGTAVANIDKPFSIIVPGLAGIPVKEEQRSRAVILKAIASGESNLYVRNILLLLKKEDLLADFISSVKSIFPDFELDIKFDESSDLYIDINVNIGNHRTPLELSGTGILQSIQIFAYITLFKPRFLLLDEPDSHLHPDNQNKLVETIISVTQKYDTKIIISTHSRHIVDGFLDNANYIRLADGKIVEQGIGLKRLSMLIDIGALDKYDKLKDDQIECVVLTEDSSKKLLEKILEFNGFPMERLMVVSYKTCSNIQAAIVFIEFIKEISGNCKVVIHRDSDFMIESESGIVKEKITSNGGIPFLTKYSDIEAYYLNPNHIGHILGKTVIEITTWLDELAKDNHVELQALFQQKREELKSLYRDNPTTFPSTLDIIAKTIPLPFEQRKGKKMMKLVNGNMQTKFGHSYNLINHSPYMVLDDFAELRKIVIGKK